MRKFARRCDSCNGVGCDMCHWSGKLLMPGTRHRDNGFNETMLGALGLIAVVVAAVLLWAAFSF